jgi:hypothetical protein
VPTLPFVRELVIGTVFIGVRATRTQGNFVTTVRIASSRAEDFAGAKVSFEGSTLPSHGAGAGLPLVAGR